MSSKVMYSYYLKSVRVSGGCTNKVILMKKTGINYNTFRRVFDRGKEFLYEDESVIIIKLKSDEIVKGRQRIEKKDVKGWNQ